LNFSRLLKIPGIYILKENKKSNPKSICFKIQTFQSYVKSKITKYTVKILHRNWWFGAQRLTITVSRFPICRDSWRFLESKNKNETLEVLISKFKHSTYIKRKITKSTVKILHRNRWFGAQRSTRTVFAVPDVAPYRDLSVLKNENVVSDSNLSRLEIEIPSLFILKK
jgi:hypothetical protein